MSLGDNLRDLRGLVLRGFMASWQRVVPDWKALMLLLVGPALNWLHVLIDWSSLLYMLIYPLLAMVTMFLWGSLANGVMRMRPKTAILNLGLIALSVWTVWRSLEEVLGLWQTTWRVTSGFHLLSLVHSYMDLTLQRLPFQALLASRALNTSNLHSAGMHLDFCGCTHLLWSMVTSARFLARSRTVRLTGKSVTEEFPTPESSPLVALQGIFLLVLCCLAYLLTEERSWEVLSQIGETFTTRQQSLVRGAERISLLLPFRGLSWLGLGQPRTTTNGLPAWRKDLEKPLEISFMAVALNFRQMEQTFSLDLLLCIKVTILVCNTHWKAIRTSFGLKTCFTLSDAFKDMPLFLYGCLLKVSSLMITLPSALHPEPPQKRTPMCSSSWLKLEMHMRSTACRVLLRKMWLLMISSRQLVLRSTPDLLRLHQVWSWLELRLPRDLGCLWSHCGLQPYLSFLRNWLHGCQAPGSPLCSTEGVFHLLSRTSSPLRLCTMRLNRFSSCLGLVPLSWRSWAVWFRWLSPTSQHLWAGLSMPPTPHCRRAPLSRPMCLLMLRSACGSMVIGRATTPSSTTASGQLSRALRSMMTPWMNSLLMSCVLEFARRSPRCSGLTSLKFAEELERFQRSLLYEAMS